jgi:hypothetical protein
MSICGAQAPTFSVVPHGGLSLSLLQIVRSSETHGSLRPYDTTWLNGYWLESMISNLLIDARVGERLKVQLGFQGGLWFSMADANAEQSTPSKNGYIEPTRADAIYSWGDTAKPCAQLVMGYFPFNYAPETRSLGSYLFRSGTYPGFVMSGDPTAHLAGLQFSAQLPASLRHNVFVTTEMYNAPMYDVSLAYVGQLDAGKFVNIAAGFMLDRLISVDKTLTSLKLTPPRYPSASAMDMYIDSNGDTTFYTKAGTKVMGRISLDLKAFISSSRLGEEDLKFYTEAAILGTKNYPGYYEKIADRIPGMVGFTLPAFRLLDVCAIEAEYYGSPWRNNPSNDGLAIPSTRFDFNGLNYTIWNPDSIDQTTGKGHTDNIKWAVYAQRTIKNRVTFGLKVASDHFRDVIDVRSSKRTELLHSPAEWYWQFSTNLVF